MANEYLQRTPTSTGNRRVWTWSGWIKFEKDKGDAYIWHCTTDTANHGFITYRNGNIAFAFNVSSTTYLNVSTVSKIRDFSSWSNLIVVLDTTQTSSRNRYGIYINGIYQPLTITTEPTINISSNFNTTAPHFLGMYGSSISSTYSTEANIADVFFIDGQALTPDVFGFYKVGKGYVSAGSTQSTDFRPGQWVPKTPRVIKTAINNNGGFGVNGFYLPMNDSNNFGADFHCDPNSIIKLQENLPQPRSRIDGAGDYTGALRDDPFKQYLIYAQPNVLGGLQNGYGDYSHIIRGSGSPKTITGGDAGASGTPVISTTQSLYYGSSLYFDGSNDTINVETNDSNYLGRDFTIEFWIWMDSQATQMAFNTTPHTSFAISLNRGGSGQTALFIGNGSSWQLTDFRSGGVLYSQQWNHVAVERYNNAITIYHNGVAQGSYKQGDQVVTNSGTFTGVMPTGSSSLFRYGTYNNISGEPLFGYIQDYRVYSGVAKYKGGFDVPKPYTPVGIATWRAVPDSPANNFATMNPLIEARPSSGSNSPSNSTIVTFADGNLNLSNSASSGNAQRMVSFATIGISTGKWYYEEIPSSNSRVGLSKGFQQLNYTGGTLGSGSGLESSVTYIASGLISLANNAYYNTATTLTPPSYNNTNIIGVSIDASLGENNLTVRFYKDGVGVSALTGVGATSPVREWFPTKTMESSGSGDQRYFNFGQNPTFSGNTTAGTYTDSNNKGLFKYQPPSGFLALCEDNLPTPAISDPGKYFKTVLYTGDGNSGRSIVGVGFQPDFVWIKARTIAYNHRVFDSVRGAGKDNFLLPNSTAVEGDSGNYYGGISSFDADGFSMVYGTGGSNIGINASGENYVAWCWRAGAGTTSTNTNGSITSVVSVNQDAGFSIVSYTGTGSAGATVGHGLGITPAMVIIKSRNEVRSWIVFHRGASPTPNPLSSTTFALGSLSSGCLSLNLANGTFTYTMDGQTNVNGNTYIAYCWAEIEGFSKAFSYIGNGSADGPMIFLGLKPALIIIKRTNDSGNWQIYDSSRMSTNPNNGVLFPNLSNVEGTGSAYDIDFLSNGFKLRSTDTDRNASGSTYVGFAWAESPFQTANSK